MKTLLATIAAAAVLTFGALVPATAFDFSGCGVFEVIALKQAIFENSQNFTDVKGDVLVANPDGFIRTGQKNTFGVLIAHRIEMQSGSKANFCFADEIVGNVAGCLVTGPFVIPATCSAQPWPPGIVVPQIPSICLPGTDVVISVSQSLAPGCYKSIKRAADVDLTLESGAFYFVKNNVQIGNRGSVVGSVAGTRATLVAGGQLITGVDVELTDLFLIQLGTATMQLFNRNILNNVIAVTPNSILHIHNGSILKGGSALAANSLDAEPIISLASDTPPVLCECPTGFVFKLQSCTSVSCDAARECVPAN